jgi:hypothetical protein
MMELSGGFEYAGNLDGRRVRSDVNERPEQAEPNAPGLPIAVHRGGALVDAHDQADAVLQVLVGEAHPVADPEFGAAGAACLAGRG